MGQARIKSTECGYDRRNKALAGIFCAAAIGLVVGIVAMYDEPGIDEPSSPPISVDQAGDHSVSNPVQSKSAPHAWAQVLKDAEDRDSRVETGPDPYFSKEQIKHKRLLQTQTLQREYEQFSESHLDPYERYSFVKTRLRGDIIAGTIYSDNDDDSVKAFFRQFQQMARDIYNEAKLQIMSYPDDFSGNHERIERMRMVYTDCENVFDERAMRSLEDYADEMNTLSQDIYARERESRHTHSTPSYN
jgi:hypothetical protein